MLGGPDWAGKKVRNVVGRNIEISEAVIQIQSTAGSGATRDVVLSLPHWWCRRERDCCIKSGRSNGRGRLDHGGQASEYNK